MTAPALNIPGTVNVGPVTLVRWEARLAEGLKAAIDESLDGIRAWLPWGGGEPSELPVIVERVEKFRREFGLGGTWAFAIVDRDTGEVLGGIGLHGRIGPTAIEIGYWIRRGAAGRGIATSCVSALTAVAMAGGASHVEIHCDPRNTASARVAAKAGYRHAVTRPRDYTALGGEPRDTMVWVWPVDADPYVAPPA
ncbi:MAG TPA: GNAT family N-acetyltransferase [Gemmatimonadaceae bacterium]|nr:GNAT family N-acetyltransferase [Gemmatimonadaceae bacterium]